MAKSAEMLRFSDDMAAQNLHKLIKTPKRIPQKAIKFCRRDFLRRDIFNYVVYFVKCANKREIKKHTKCETTAGKFMKISCHLLSQLINTNVKCARDITESGWKEKFFEQKFSSRFKQLINKVKIMIILWHLRKLIVFIRSARLWIIFGDHDHRKDNIKNSKSRILIFITQNSLISDLTFEAIGIFQFN